MEKIFLKPDSKEILIKNSSKESVSDIFSYDCDTDELKRKLGNLFVVGNVQTLPDAAGNDAGAVDSAADERPSDVAYVVNLVALLAKREYYAKTDISPKEAFSATLKKINGVIEEFFKTRVLKLNIGIFVIAGENIHIAKLGKFKILLARENRIIDILNNIDLFSKEAVQEKEFSHIISGKISSGDKISAYHPAQPLTVREKTLKELLITLDGGMFADKLTGIKETNKNFYCAAVYINMNKVREPAKLLTPHKLVPSAIGEPTLAAAGTTKEKIIASDGKDFAPKNKNNVKTTEHNPPTSAELRVSETLPQIIPAEFSLGKKDNPIFTLLNKIRIFTPRLRSKTIFFSFVAVLVLLALLAVKFVFISSPEEKAAARTINEVKTALRSAKTQIGQNNFVSARRLLAASLLNLKNTGGSGAEETRSQLTEILDEIDKASPASLALIENLPPELTEAISVFAAETANAQTGKYGPISAIKDFSLYEGNLYVLTADSIYKIADIGKNQNAKAVRWLQGNTQLLPEPRLIAVDGDVFALNASGLLVTYYKGKKTNEINTFAAPEETSKLFAPKNSELLYLVNQITGRIHFVNKKTGALEKTSIIGSIEPVANAMAINDGRLFVITKDNKIWEVK